MNCLRGRRSVEVMTKKHSDHEIFITKIYINVIFSNFTKILNHENLELCGSILLLAMIATPMDRTHYTLCMCFLLMRTTGLVGIGKGHRHHIPSCTIMQLMQAVRRVCALSFILNFILTMFVTS